MNPKKNANHLQLTTEACFDIDFQKNNFAALSVGNGRKRPIPSLLPCEINFLKIYRLRTFSACFIIFIQRIS